MVRYSPRAAVALGYLKRPLNDIEVYVEDTCNPLMWVRLLSQIVPLGTKLTSVNMLGGRDAVLAACKLDQANDNRRKLYVIDADMDYLYGKRKPALKHLYRIGAYCIENTLAGDSAILAVAQESLPNLSAIEVASKVNLPSIHAEFEKSLRPLFEVYAATRKVSPQTKTVSLKLEGLITSTPVGPILDETKVRLRIKSLILEARKNVSLSEFGKLRRSISAISEKLTIHRVVSGKDYILLYIYLRLRRTANYRGTPEQLKARLAASFKKEYEPRFWRAISKI